MSTEEINNDEQRQHCVARKEKGGVNGNDDITATQDIIRLFC